MSQLGSGLASPGTGKELEDHDVPRAKLEGALGVLVAIAVRVVVVAGHGDGAELVTGYPVVDSGVGEVVGQAVTVGVVPCLGIQREVVVGVCHAVAVVVGVLGVVAQAVAVVVVRNLVRVVRVCPALVLVHVVPSVVVGVVCHVTDAVVVRVVAVNGIVDTVSVVVGVRAVAYAVSVEVCVLGGVQRGAVLCVRRAVVVVVWVGLVAKSVTVVVRVTGPVERAAVPVVCQEVAIYVVVQSVADQVAVQVVGSVRAIERVAS